MAEHKVDDDDDLWSGPTARQQLEAQRRARQADFSRGWRRISMIVVVAVVCVVLWRMWQ